MSMDAALAAWIATVKEKLPPVDYRAMAPREAAAAMRRQQMAGVAEPIPGLATTDLLVPGAPPVAVRLYRPDAGRPLPIIMSFHGGGWVLGNIDTDDASCRQLAMLSGCAVASVDYRLAPEHRFPAASDDCYNATVWMARHADEFGLDASRIAVCGSSAGGNLAASVALQARDRNGPPLRFQMLIYPICDASMDFDSYRENPDVFPLPADYMAWFWTQYAPDAAARRSPYAAPLRADSLADLPPAHVITAALDPLRDEGIAYARALAAAGVATTSRNYAGLVHGFLTIAGHLPEIAAIRQDIAERLAAALRG